LIINELQELKRSTLNFRRLFAVTSIKDIGLTRLVILIDDLDRCLPETAIQTLEASKLFLFLPHVAFIVAADEGMIEYSVKKHFPDMPIGPAGASYARAYLEKLIQVPFRIPALGDVEIHAYIALTTAEAVLGSESGDFKNLLNMARDKLQKPWEGARLKYSEILKEFPGIAPKVQHSLTLSDQLANVLARGTLGNPRQVKRFLNSLMLREAIAKGRGMQAMIKRPVLAKIMLAERFHSEFYADLCKAANLARDGKVKQLSRLETLQKEEDSAGQGKTKKTALDPAWEKWANDETLCEWAALSPKLEAEDLRPYVFVTRDKKAIFGLQGGGPLDAMADTLMGPRIQVSSHSAKLKALSESDASQIFDKLRSRILTEDSFEDTTGGGGPGGFQGIVVLVSEHPELQEQFIRFLEELPVSKLRVWVVNHGVKFSGQAEASWKALMTKWGGQTENTTLANATKAVAPARKK
jgi:predicted KAP-like P-loop ATPase